MDDRKTTLYLALLCIVLVIWGSVLDGKRKHVQEVLEAENAELLTLVDETRASFEEASTRQSELAHKLKSLQRELKILKARNRELQKLNKQLKAELQEARILRKEAEKKAAEAVKNAARPAAPVLQTAPPAHNDNIRIRELEKKLDRLIRERDGMRSSYRRDSEDNFTASLAVTELESQLRFCREQVRGLKEDSIELRELKSRVRELERQLASKTQELWDTRLNLSADLDNCTRQLMRASEQAAAKPPAPPGPPPCMKKMEQTGKAEAAQKPCAKKCAKKGSDCKCPDCPRLKEMEAKLQTCSCRLEQMQKEFHDSNIRHMEEIAQLKKALAGKMAMPKPSGETVEKSVPPPEIELGIKEKDAEIARLKAEIGQKEKELSQYRKNTEALLEQIRLQRAELKKLKAAGKGT